VKLVEDLPEDHKVETKFHCTLRG